MRALRALKGASGGEALVLGPGGARRMGRALVDDFESQRVLRGVGKVKDARLALRLSFKATGPKIPHGASNSTRAKLMMSNLDWCCAVGACQPIPTECGGDTGLNVQIWCVEAQTPSRAIFGGYAHSGRENPPLLFRPPTRPNSPSFPPVHFCLLLMTLICLRVMMR